MWARHVGPSAKYQARSHAGGEGGGGGSAPPGQIWAHIWYIWPIYDHTDSCDILLNCHVYNDTLLSHWLTTPASAMKWEPRTPLSEVPGPRSSIGSS